MINYSKHPAPHVRIGYDKLSRAWFAKFLNTLKSLSKAQDSSGGKLKSALNAIFTKLYVTSDLYMDDNAGSSVQLFNVKVSGQDYRVVLGYDNKIVRVETLDARAADARTKSEAAYWARQQQPPTPVPPPSDDENDGLYNTDPDDPDNYNTDAIQATQPHTYGRPECAYGQVIPVGASQYGQGLPGNQ
jgi:hypothetical protein